MFMHSHGAKINSELCYMSTKCVTVYESQEIINWLEEGEDVYCELAQAPLNLALC